MPTMCGYSLIHDQIKSLENEDETVEDVHDNEDEDDDNDDVNELPFNVLVAQENDELLEIEDDGFLGVGI